MVPHHASNVVVVLFTTHLLLSVSLAQLDSTLTLRMALALVLLVQVLTYPQVVHVSVLVVVQVTMQLVMCVLFVVTIHTPRMESFVNLVLPILELLLPVPPSV